MRERTLTLPVMMALVLSMIWRQISSVGELVRTVQQQCLLWETPRKLTPQAVSQRLNSLPARSVLARAGSDLARVASALGGTPPAPCRQK